MKRLLRNVATLCLFALTLGSASAQIVITEISYNPPEGGLDTLEFIELYNNGASAVNMAGYSFSQGVTYTFPSIMVNAGDYIVVAVDSSALVNTLSLSGITVRQWTSGGLSNSGEDIVLKDAGSATVDSVDYENSGLWPTVANGQGHTLVLCDPNADNNDPANWEYADSTTSYGLSINGYDYFGTVGSSGGCAVAQSGGPCSDLFFSEYIEGSSSNKALEIYNPTTSTIDLTDYVVYRANNGSLTPTDSIFPIGMVAAGDVFVIGNPSANAAIQAQQDTTHSLTFYNGDDAVYMIKISTGDTIDVIGEVGVDPGSGWPVGTGATNNFTLIRMSTVHEGETDWILGSTQWDVFPIDMTDSLGAHTMIACGSPIFPSVFFTSTSQTVGEGVGTVTVTVGINNPDGNATSVDVVVNGSSTATGGGTDYTYTSPTTVTFPANDNTPQTVTITIVDDALLESSEDIDLDLMNQTNSATLGTSTHTVSITDNDAVLTPTGSCSDLFFSEYVEGSSNNKALEIYNPTLLPVDLGNYQVQRFTNGSTSASGTYTWPAGTMLNAGDVYIIANASADPIILAEADTTNAATFFNGDDAVLLYNLATSDSIDIIGVIGVDPGTNWTVGSGATSEYTLVRAINVQDGTTDWSVSQNQWEVFPQNTWDSLGTHTAWTCFTGPVVYFDTASTIVNEDIGTVSVQVNILNADANPTSVDVALLGSSTASAGPDFTFASPTTVTFPGGSSAPQTVTIPIIDDTDVEGTEVIDLELTNATNGAGEIADSTYSITIIDNDVSTVFFNMTAMTVLEDVGSVNVQVDILNPAATATTVDVVLGTSTATNGADFTFTSPTTVTFPAGSNASQTVNIPITDDALTESAENFELMLANNSAGSVIGNDTTTLITINDNDINIYPIGDVNTVDATGVADSLGVYCGIRGVVYGVDMRGGPGLQFTIIDQTGGIGVFSSTNDYGYTVTEMDSVELRGTIAQFNGLTQMDIDTVIYFTPNNPLKTPTVVTVLDESTESDLVRLNGVTLVDPLQWTGAGSGFNVDVTDGNDTWTVRIDSDVDLYALPAPDGRFDVCGLGGQFDNSTPFDDGYQLLPRYNADIKPVVDLGPDRTVCGEVDLNSGWSAGNVWNTSATTQMITTTGDGTYSVVVSYGTSIGGDTVVMTILDAPVAAFIVQDTACVDDVVAFTNATTGGSTYDWDFDDGNVSTDMDPTNTFTAAGSYEVTLIADNGTCTDTVSVNVIVEDCSGFGEFEAGELNVYPTLTSGQITLDFNLNHGQSVNVAVRDLSGRELANRQFSEVSTQKETMDLATLPQGLYLLTVRGESSVSTFRIVIR